MQGMTSTLQQPIDDPVVAELDGVKLRLHARRLRGSMSLVEVARRANLNRDELSRLERGETSQVRFSTLAKLLVVYDCGLDDLIEVEKSRSTEPLYAGALGAFADGTLGVSRQRRRAARRPAGADHVDDDESAMFVSSESVASSRRRTPVGTIHP